MQNLLLEFDLNKGSITSVVASFSKASRLLPAATFAHSETPCICAFCLTSLCCVSAAQPLLG